MLGMVKQDGQGNKYLSQIAGATLGQGVPLGAWCSFEKDVAPSNNWLMAGTTFDATVYPALALYLGGTKVPERYDHSRLGAEETPQSRTLPSTPETAMTMPYDGIIRIGCGRNNNFIYISSDNGVTWQPHQYCNSNGSTYTINIPFEVRKGDKIYVTDPSACEIVNVRYYTHPLFIKATSIASDTDQQAILAQIQAYNTYSTEETLTGKTWIDGKPIYRKVMPMYRNSTLQTGFTATGGGNYTSTVTPSNMERIIINYATIIRQDGLCDTVISPAGNNYGFCANINGNVYLNINLGTFKDIDLVFEYTKSTD